MKAESWFAQTAARCRLEWGRQGALNAAARGDALVIVDVLSFTSAVATAVQQGGGIYPCAENEDIAAFAARIGAEVAVRREEVPAKGRFSLSPCAFLALEPGAKVAVASPNGATCCRVAAQSPVLYAGALLNADAVAQATQRLLNGGHCVTVVACGERWQTPNLDGNLRFAIEDYLGAGAILAALHADLSPEAQVCAGAFREARANLEPLLWESGSGIELRDKGFPEDVRHSARLNLYDTVPVLRDGGLVGIRTEE